MSLLSHLTFYIIILYYYKKIKERASALSRIPDFILKFIF